MSKTYNKTVKQTKNHWNIFRRNYLINWQLYLMLLLPLIYIVIFHYIPMAGVQLAFRKYDFTKGIWNSPFVGFDNFIRFFSIPNFKKILLNTIIISAYNLLASFPMPIILALLLNAIPYTRYRKVVQSVSYMPHFISTVVMVGIIMQILNPRTGGIGNIYSSITGEMMTDLMGSAKAFRHIYVWSGIWQSVGWSSIIYMAALSSVDAELHEAAEIDGATRLQRVWAIDFPSILPTAVIMLILSAGNIMSIGFEKVYLMQNSLNISTSEVISTYVYKVGMQQNDFSFATAIGLFNSVINLIMLILVNGISRRISESSLW